MSTEKIMLRALVRSNVPSPSTPRLDTMRLNPSRRMEEAAPWADCDPTSSWSKSATMRTLGSAARPSSLTESIIARRHWKLEQRLSRRPLFTNSPRVPEMVDACVSTSCNSQSTTCSPSARPSSSRRTPTRKECSSSVEDPAASLGTFSCAMNTAWQCSCRLGLKLERSSPEVRWMARLGMRAMGRSTCTRRCSMSPEVVRTRTRPARPRSRSNHVCHRPPP
mmetsp:Transcript_1487/g.5141  ORF Transcript_1487/g.5141 Transcript_1487/m.5141 type:complete len:222 (+) Transcript_1487:477-1142(+)